MFYSNKLSQFNNIKHCFFSRKNGFSKGIYGSLNCGLGSGDKKENVHPLQNCINAMTSYMFLSIISSLG